MDEQTLKLLASQLRKPEGEMGKEVAQRMNKGNEGMNLRTIEILNPAPGDRILEIGMGNGFFIKNILSIDKSIKYTGCDYSELMIDEARELNKEYVDNGQADFYLTSAGSLPFGDSQFNKLFTVNTIYFWDYPEQVLSEINRVLKPKGRLIITYRPKSVLDGIPFVKFGFIVYSDEQIKEMIMKAGFDILEMSEKFEPSQNIHGEIEDVASIVLVAEKK